MSLMAGAGKRQIEIPEGYPALEGFGQIHDPLHARVLILQQEEAFALVSLELTSLMGQEVLKLKEQVSAWTGIPQRHIWICTVHSFSSPHLLPDQALKTPEKIALRDRYWQNICSAVEGAVHEALLQLQEAVTEVGTAFCSAAGNRDTELADGWWVGEGREGMTDPEMTILRFIGKDEKNIAILMHYGMQSSVMDQAVLADGKKPVTSDAAGLACRLGEQQYGGVMIYMIGAAGDQAPTEKAVTERFENGEKVRTDKGQEGFAMCERLADQLLTAVDTALSTCGRPQDTAFGFDERQITLPTKKMNGSVHTLKPCSSIRYEEDGEGSVTLHIWKIGKIAFIGTQPELNCVSAAQIREQSAFRHTLICTMVNGAAKYMADEASYDRITYEAMNSPWQRGAAEKLAEQSTEMLSKLS